MLTSLNMNSEIYRTTLTLIPLRKKTEYKLKYIFLVTDHIKKKNSAEHGYNILFGPPIKFFMFQIL